MSSSGLEMTGSWANDEKVDYSYRYNGKEHVAAATLGWYDYVNEDVRDIEMSRGRRETALSPRYRQIEARVVRWFYDSAIGRFTGVDPLAEKYYNLTPYNYVMNNPLIYTDPFGLDTMRVHVFDQAVRPNDNGTAGTTYTVDIYVFDDETGELNGPYSGSSYPNSVSNSDNSTTANTVNAGEHEYNNDSGHKGSTKKGLNLVDSNGNRNSPGTDPEGNDVTMTNVNVHSGQSDKGNYNSRGSRGCITLCPNDSNNFFDNFDFSGTNSNTGTSTGTINISRGNKAQGIRNLKTKASNRRAEYSEILQVLWHEY